MTDLFVTNLVDVLELICISDNSVEYFYFNIGETLVRVSRHVLNIKEHNFFLNQIYLLFYV